MSEGNPGAIMVLLELTNDSTSILDILLCDTLDIRGSKLYLLHNDCCDKNKDKFDRTLQLLKSSTFHKNK